MVLSSKVIHHLLLRSSVCSKIGQFLFGFVGLASSVRVSVFLGLALPSSIRAGLPMWARKFRLRALLLGTGFVGSGSLFRGQRGLPSIISFSGVDASIKVYDNEIPILRSAQVLKFQGSCMHWPQQYFLSMCCSN